MGDGTSMSRNTSVFGNDDHEGRFMVFGAHDDSRDSEVGTRLEWRNDQLVDQIGTAMEDEAAATP